MSCDGTLKWFMRFVTASPDLFMNVVGFARMTFSPLMLISATFAWRGLFVLNLMSCILASSSTIMNPRLCLVFVYALPGLPRPTMSFIDGDF